MGRPEVPNVEREKMLEASRIAARGHGALLQGHAVRLRRLADRGASVTGLTSELDASWISAHRIFSRTSELPALRALA